MSKVHNITGIIAATFIIIMLFILIIPIDFANKSIEQIYDDNGGLVWGITAIIGVAITVMSYMTGIFYYELSKCTKIANDKNDVINSQNETIIKNLELSAKRQLHMSQQITDNSEKDIQVKHEINNQTKKIDKLYNMVERNEITNNKELKSIREWITNHEEQHKKVKV